MMMNAMQSHKEAGNINICTYILTEVMQQKSFFGKGQ